MGGRVPGQREYFDYYRREAKKNSSAKKIDVGKFDVPYGRFVKHREIWVVEYDGVLPDDRIVKIKRRKDNKEVLVRLATGPIIDNLYSFTYLGS